MTTPTPSAAVLTVLVFKALQFFAGFFVAYVIRLLIWLCRPGLFAVFLLQVRGSG